MIGPSLLFTTSTTLRGKTVKSTINTHKQLLIFSFNSPNDVEDLFYLKPSKNWKYSQDVWFEKRPIGKNMLDQRVKTMCKEAGIEGNFSNHSLRATSITRMYDAGVPEKQIMKRSGHKSLEGVRTYQREEGSETRQVSNVLASSKEVSMSTSNVQDEDGDDDDLLANALNEFEKKSTMQSITLSGLLSNLTINNLKINVTINK